MRMRDETENSEETNLWKRNGAGIVASHLLRKIMIGELFVTWGGEDGREEDRICSTIFAFWL